MKGFLNHQRPETYGSLSSTTTFRPGFNLSLDLLRTAQESQRVEIGIAVLQRVLRIGPQTVSSPVAVTEVALLALLVS